MITISRGLPNHHRRRAAEIYWEAFGDKLQLPLGPREFAIRYFDAAMNGARAVIALDADENLVGIAGFDTGEGGLISGDNQTVFDIYGWSAWWRLPVLAMFERDTHPNTMIIDGIAVSREMRSQGIGGRMLDELASIGQEKSLGELWLDVLTTNPRAKTLYLRKGFQTRQLQPTGLVRKLFNFDPTERMIKIL